MSNPRRRMDVRLPCTCVHWPVTVWLHPGACFVRVQQRQRTCCCMGNPRRRMEFECPAAESIGRSQCGSTLAHALSESSSAEGHACRSWVLPRPCMANYQSDMCVGMMQA